MYYEVELQDYVRVPPSSFDLSTEESILKTLNNRFKNFILRDLGLVVAVSEIKSVGEGVIIPGDGAAYFDTAFKVITFKPEVQEVILGKISDITDFGAFMNIGAIDGMIHVSQTMDDYVSFSKAKVLSGKETKRTLKVGDECRARIIAVSYKELFNPKIGLTMRQPWLGSLSWIKDDLKKQEKAVVKEGKAKK
ncbi:MAG: DNA-directed RNA polymerase [Candidatus Woesearchaeota archaeon]|nr:MAG: DNA-directed RNA polymerase [Candidatus Woesearchaeota archaeon]